MDKLELVVICLFVLLFGIVLYLGFVPGTDGFVAAYPDSLPPANAPIGVKAYPAPLKTREPINIEEPIIVEEKPLTMKASMNISAYLPVIFNDWALGRQPSV